MTVTEVRKVVFARDGQCVAPILDKKSGPCYDKWGGLLPPWMPLRKGWEVLEMDYVRLGAIGAHHELPADHIMVCPGHHRGTGTSHRAQQRAYLDRMNGPRQG